MATRAARARSEEMTLQQLMGMVHGLQDAVAASKVEQERMQADLTASQVRSEELHRTNEELRHRWRGRDEPEATSPPREFTTPFSQAILETAIPNTFTGPKAMFTGTEDPEAHLTAFHTQMLLVGGSDAAKCKLFMSTLTGMAMDWFISLPEGHVTSFAQLSKLFRERYLANRTPAPVSYDLFDVKQFQGETLKEYISRFGAQVVKVGTKEEPMIVYAFKKGVRPGSFSKTLNRSRPKTFAEKMRQAVEHIASEGETYEKSTTTMPARPKAQIRTQPIRVHQAATERKHFDRTRAYEPRRAQFKSRVEEGRGVRKPPRHSFVMELKDLIAIPSVADRLRPPIKADKVLGPRKESWCEFHEAFGHHINNCLALGYQLDELVKSGFLKDYLMEKQAGRPPGLQAGGSEGQQHEAPVLGEIHTIAGGFLGGGCTASQRKKYARSVMSVEVFKDHSPDVDITFTKGDLKDVVPHDNDPIVISLVTAGRTVHRVLVDQGSSADVMFWPTFERLQLSTDQLRPYGGCLYGFAGDQVEVRGYIELRTTFTDGTASRTEKVKYLVVNAPSAYNILLGRPTLNRIGAVPSTRHMKVKLPSMEGVIVTIRSDQEEAKRCYENSLKNRRSVCHVTTTPPPGAKDTQEGRRTMDAATEGTTEDDTGMDMTLEVAIDGDVTMRDVESEPENSAGVEE
ncbi:uncharacterized protein [Phaseolus vulgaris]|uniref:uncharacterized protein n=1 Tax=Phaseolus vulgaris TaxID=3885 RepID=UPI0035CC79DB